MVTGTNASHAAMAHQPVHRGQNSQMRSRSGKRSVFFRKRPTTRSAHTASRGSLQRQSMETSTILSRRGQLCEAQMRDYRAPECEVRVRVRIGRMGRRRRLAGPWWDPPRAQRHHCGAERGV